MARAPRPVTEARVSCDVFLIAVSDASMPAQATAGGSPERLDVLAKELANGLHTSFPERKSIAVLTLRNRSRTQRCQVVCEELADKLTGALIAKQRFAVKARIDVKSILDEKDFQAAQLDSSEILKDPRIRARISGVDYLVIGGVTVTDPDSKP